MNVPVNNTCKATLQASLSGTGFLEARSRKQVVNRCWEYAAGKPNSKQWFTTSFLQPLPYLVTPQGPENCQLTSSFFVGAQTVVSLLQTTQIKQGVSFTAANKVYSSTNKTTIVWIETELLIFLSGVDTSLVYVRALALGCFYSHITLRTSLSGTFLQERMS